MKAKADQEFDHHPTRPNCYNRAEFKDSVLVQDGWIMEERVIRCRYVLVRLPRMVYIPDPMSKECKQHEPTGAARMYGWNCDGCKWKK